MKRALIYASVASMIEQFNMDNIRLLLSLGYEVDVACNMEHGSSISDEAIVQLKETLVALGVNVYHIPIPRKVTAVGQIFKSIRVTLQLLNERAYSLIHCHSPIGGMICRLANRLGKNYKYTKMIYTAHGFHFFKGGPLINWLLFYPIEKLCSCFTNVLITINREDYSIAKNKMHAKNVVYVPGVGIETDKYINASVDKKAQRAVMGVPENALLLVSVGELNINKNHSTVIRAIAQIENQNVHYAIVGKGALQGELQNLAQELGIQNQIHLLGYSSLVVQIYAAADVCVFPSLREGLGLAALEGMASGLPLICADNRGTRDYAKDGHNAYVCKADSADEFAVALKRLMELSEEDRQVMGHSARDTAQNFDLRNVSSVMENIYRNI